MLCTVEGCARRSAALGFCEAHYRRHYRHGDTFADVPVGASHRSDPVDCTCAAPDPDSIGECRRCRRLVVMASA